METVGSILLALLGIGFLVFIHETGHFLAAKWCGVHIHVFSLGFGPRVFGIVKNGCDYRLSLVPVGGYVRMEGELGDGDDGDPSGSLSRKHPLQRIFVYSAGVLMNFAVAFAIFPFVFYFGVPLTRPVVGHVQAGSPAWSAGILPGTIIRAVNGRPLDSFDELQVEIALASSPVKLTIEEPKPGSPGQYVSRELECATVMEAGAPMPRLGVEPAHKLLTFKDAAGAAHFGFPITVNEGSAAHAQGIRTGDLLVAVDGVNASYTGRVAMEEKLDALGGREATLVVWAAQDDRQAELRERLERGVTFSPRPLEGTERPILGVFASSRVVKAVRSGGAADRLGLRAKDEILTIQGAPFFRASDLTRKAAGAPALELEILREKAAVKLTAALSDIERESLVNEIQFDPVTTRVGVVPGLAGDLAGIRSGDVLVKIGEAEVHTWPDVQKAIAAAEGKEVKVEVDRRSFLGSSLGDGPPTVDRFTTKVKPASSPVYDFGLRFLDDKEPLRAAGPVDACVKGFDASVKLIRQIAFLLKKIALGDVPAKEHLGGPISIAAQSYQVAQSGVLQFLYFLGMLSLNLALINVLPIPVLDGGNLLFVVVEAVKGSPVSDRVLGASQTVGVFLLIALMVWVTFHDVRRVFGLFS